MALMSNLSVVIVGGLMLFAEPGWAQESTGKANYADPSKYIVAVGVMKPVRFIEATDDVGMTGKFTVSMKSRRILHNNVSRVDLAADVNLVEADHINNWNIVFVVTNDKDRNVIMWSYIHGNKLCLPNEGVSEHGWRMLARKALGNDCVIL